MCGEDGAKRAAAGNDVAMGVNGGCEEGAATRAVAERLVARVTMQRTAAGIVAVTTEEGDLEVVADGETVALAQKVE